MEQVPNNHNNWAISATSEEFAEEYRLYMEEVLGDAGEDKVRVAPWWGRVFTRSFIIEAEPQIVLRRKKCSLFPLTSPKN